MSRLENTRHFLRSVLPVVGGILLLSVTLELADRYLPKWWGWVLAWL